MYIFLIEGISLSDYFNIGAGIGQQLFGHIFQVSATSSAYWPPFLGSSSSGNTGVALLFVGASFVIFTLIPKVNELIQALLTGKPFAYGTAIGEAFGGVGLAYGASGAKDQVELFRRGFSNQRVLNTIEQLRKEQGVLGRAYGSLAQTKLGKKMDMEGILQKTEETATHGGH
jgi:hypothetical protein